MKPANIYNELVRFYNRSRRKLQCLVVQRKNMRKQDILQRRIARLLKTVMGMQRALKIRMATAALSAGMLLFQPDAAQAQITFGEVQDNPFGLTATDGWSSPAFADLDGDGDLDLMSGDYLGVFYYFENTGTSASPAFAAPQTNPFGLTDIGKYSMPAFADLDGDGNIDMMTGDEGGNFFYFQNTGTATAPAFSAAQTNPFGLTDIGLYSAPSFADLDGDGDMDLMTGELYGSFIYFQNTGTAAAPAFAAAQTIPVGLTDGDYISTPAFADLDGDGDMEMVTGEFFGSFFYFQNTGTAAAPVFAAAQDNPFGLTDIGYRSTTVFTDLDGDGDLDLMSGVLYGGFFYFENTTSESSSCDIPTNLSATNITSSSATLNWGAEAGAEGYKVRYKVSGTNPWIVKNARGNSKNLHNLIPNTSYDWEVKTYCTINPGLSSDWSGKEHFTTGTLKLASAGGTFFDVYPNPFNASSIISFSLAHDSRVQIQLVDVTGRKLQAVLDESLAAGNHEVTLKRGQLSAGIYFLQLKMNEEVITKKVVIE